MLGLGHGSTTTTSCSEMTTAQPWGYLAAGTGTISLRAHFRLAWPLNQSSSELTCHTERSWGQARTGVLKEGEGNRKME